MDNTVKIAGDVTAFAVVTGVISNILPPIAAILTIIYTGLRIYEWIKTRPDKIDK